MRVFQGTSAIRCLSTSSVLTSPSGRHFRTDIEHHPLYKDLPKPEHQQKPKEESKLAAGEEYDDYVMPHVIWLVVLRVLLLWILYKLHASASDWRTAEVHSILIHPDPNKPTGARFIFTGLVLNWTIQCMFFFLP